MRSALCLAGVSLALGMTGWAAGDGGPAVFWASDPVRPGETVVVSGDAFGKEPVVELGRLEDTAAGDPAGPTPAWPGAGQKLEPLQASDQSVKFVVPESLRPGVFVYRLSGPGGAVVGVLNRPAVWWVQGDGGTFASPGGWVRAFGKCLLPPGTENQESAPAPAPRPPRKVTLRLQGPQTTALEAECSDGFGAQAALPSDLPVGEYRVSLHGGCGGSAAWSEPVPLHIAKPAVWPQTVFNVKDFGAAGTGFSDDTAAVQAALAAAQKSGGGVVWFPRGRYQVTDTLVIPRFTVLRGEKREWVNILWLDLPKPPEALIRGGNSFGLENLTLYCSNYKTFLSGDTRGEDAGNVFLRRLCVRAAIYRGHMAPEEIDRRYREGLKVGFGGGYWLVVLGGRNLKITDCDQVHYGQFN